MASKVKVLFVCTANVNRSRAAEDILKSSPDYEVQSAGCVWHELGGQVLTQDLIDWADRIFVMDQIYDGHLSLLRHNFNTLGKDIYVLGIEDIYSRGDPILIELIKKKLLAIGGIKV